MRAPLTAPDKRRIVKELEISFPKIFAPIDQPFRYKVMYGGRGSAKSWTVARKLILRAIDKKIRILCTRELQKSIKQSVHKLICMQIEKMGFKHLFDTTNDTITCLKTGSEFIFFGVKHNADEIKSTESIDICWIEEGHNLTEASWDIIDPTIRQEGSEIWVTYNTRFKFDHLHQFFVVNTPPPDSWVEKINFCDNPFFPEVLRRQMETMKIRDHEKYLHIWMGELKKLAEGAIFGKQIAKVHEQKRNIFIPIISNCEVMTFMDIGKNDYTAIWFMQRTGMQYRFFDYFEGRLEEVEYYTRFMKDINYNYGRHYLPHDADHERLGMPRNIKKQFEDGGVKPITIVPRIAHKNTAIELAREIMPNCWFHEHNDGNTPEEECEGYVAWVSDDKMKTRAKRMEKGYETLCNYRYKFKDEDNVFQLNPHHDWASNGADAFMQFAQSNLHGGHDDGKHDDWSKPING
jgi:phage terminase large subunit